jgi:hypothetical protein
VSNQRRFAFTDPAGGETCELAVTAGGGTPVYLGVAHPRCGALADVFVYLDAFYCEACGRNGRVSGAWCLDMAETVRTGKMTHAQWRAWQAAAPMSPAGRLAVSATDRHIVDGELVADDAFYADLAATLGVADVDLVREMFREAFGLADGEVTGE